MEFLIADKDTIAGLDTACLAPVLRNSRPLTTVRAAALIHSGEMQSGLLFDGVATGDTDHLSSWLPPGAAAIAGFRAAVADNDLSGVFCYVDVQPDRVEIGVDPLSQYPVHVFARGARFLVSNNLFLIEAALLAAGIRLDRCVISTFSSLAMNSAIGLDSGIEGVALLPPNTCARIDAGGLKIVAVQRRADLYRSRPSFPHKELAARFRARMDAAVAAYSRDHRFVAALTGGRDSRVNLALLLESARLDDTRFWCGGTFPDPDKIAFVHLVNRWRLRTSSIDVTKTSDHHPATQDEISVGLSRHGAATMSEFLRYGVYAIPNIVNITGYFGEFSRGGDYHTFLFNKYTDQELSLSEMVETLVGAKPFYTEEGRRLVAARIEGLMRDILDDGVDRVGLRQAYYVENRSRAHFGVAAQVYLGSGPALFPLADIALIRASSSNDVAQVEQGLITYRLIADLASEALAREPLTGMTWPISIVSSGDAAEPIGRGETRGLSDINPGRSPLFANGPVVDRPARKRLPGVKSAAAAMETCKPLLAEAAESLGATHDIFRLVDLDALRHMTGPAYDPPDQKSKRHVYTLTSALYWLLRREVHMPRTRTATLDV